MRKALALLVTVLVVIASPVFGVMDPDERLEDPALEQRARSLSGELRCMVCQNQSIDDSDAELARDLRVLVRQRIAAGDSDEEVMSYLVSRYGEFVLLRPAFNTRNLLLWGTPVLLLIAGGGAIFLAGRRKPKVPEPTLSQDERRRLDSILDADRPS